MNIEKVITSQVSLGYLIPCGVGTYSVNKKEIILEMERRKDETELSVVSYKEYIGKLVELGVKVVN